MATMKQRLSTQKMVLTALLAALTVVGSWLRIPSPFGEFHLGNIFCALSGLILGPWWGALAAGMGSALFDVIFYPAYISECWITFLTKGIYGLMAGMVYFTGRRRGYIKATLGAAAGAIAYALIYLAKRYLYNGILLSGLAADVAWIEMLTKLPATIFNAVITIVCAPLLALAITKALQRNRLLTEG